MMTHTKLFATLMATIVIGAGLSEAKADLPGKRTAKLYIRQAPSDPNSDIIWSVTLDLEAKDSQGKDVGWRIGATHVEDYAPGQVPLRRWSETSPQVNTPDGLWWVGHADPMNPLASEFDVTPLLNGTAIATHGGEDDLEYSFGGDSYNGNPSYGGLVSRLTFSFALAGSVDPEEEGDDEPGEIDGVNEPPGPSRPVRVGSKRTGNGLAWDTTWLKVAWVDALGVCRQPAYERGRRIGRCGPDWKEPWLWLNA